MAVFRVEKNDNYSVMANYHFRDKTLSWKAKGILSNMLSLPDDWDYSLAGLETLSSDGMSATRTAIKELEDHGYLIRRPIREGGKIRDWEYIIFEYPKQDDQDIEDLLVENPQIENQTQLNTKQLNNKELNINESNTKEKKERKKPVSDSFNQLIEEYSKGNEEVKELLGEWLKVRKAKRAAMTDRAIELNLKKLEPLAAESKMSVSQYLEAVICRGWAAFYKINDYSNNQPKQQQQEKSSGNVFMNLLNNDEPFF